jgi:phospholipase/lecithinase/hemolysin
MPAEFSKKDKRIAREAIEKGLQKEFQQGLQQFDAILQKWKDGQQENRDAYHNLYKSVRNFDKHIGRRYDNIKGSTYARILGEQLADKLISEEDLAEMTPDARRDVISWAWVINSM